MCKNASRSLCLFVFLATAAPPAIGNISDGLVAYFQLDEDEIGGTFAPDSSRHGNWPRALSV
jgi:hypothetical protein